MGCPWLAAPIRRTRVSLLEPTHVTPFDIPASSHSSLPPQGWPVEGFARRSVCPQHSLGIGHSERLWEFPAVACMPATPHPSCELPPGSTAGLHPDCRAGFYSSLCGWRAPERFSESTCEPVLSISIPSNQPRTSHLSHQFSYAHHHRPTKSHEVQILRAVVEAEGLGLEESVFMSAASVVGGPSHPPHWVIPDQALPILFSRRGLTCCRAWARRLATRRDPARRAAAMGPQRSSRDDGPSLAHRGVTRQLPADTNTLVLHPAADRRRPARRTNARFGPSCHHSRQSASHW